MPEADPGITIHVQPYCLILPLLSAPVTGVKGGRVPLQPF
jgi:hypothetical protein